MLKINFTLGRWQMACASEVMCKSWKMVKKYKCTLSEALKVEWKKIKKLIKQVSSSYQQYKYKLVIDGKNYFLKFKNNNLEKVIDSCMKKIAKIKGESFINNFSEKFFSKYDLNLKKLKDKNVLTFTRNIFVVRLNE